MRAFVALCCIALCAGCFVTGPLDGDRDRCQDGWSQSLRGCVQDYQAPVVTVISIGPSRQYADTADTMCYSLSPSPASIKEGGSYRFQNNTGASVTIVDANGIPWVTTDPYASSSALTESTPGVYGFGIQGCRGAAGTPWYGVLDVTIN